MINIWETDTLENVLKISEIKQKWLKKTTTRRTGVAEHHTAAKHANVTHNKRKKWLMPQSDESYRLPTLPERALLVKLYHRISKKVALTQERMMWTDVGACFQRHDEIFCRKEKEKVSDAVLENIATAVMEASIESSHSSVSVPTISCTLDMLYPTSDICVEF